ncbi:MAG TPA: MFS transporter [Gemmatimonadales bacterium]|jgi:MFS family permease
MPGRLRSLPTFAAFRHRNFRIFYGGYVVSLTGIWMQRVAQSWLVLDLTGSAFYVGLIEALGTVPVLLFTLYAGAVADRVSKHRMVVATQAFAMVVAFGFAVMVWLDLATIGAIAVLAALLGVATAFDIPARQSFFVEIVGKEDLASAIALNASAFNATRVLGPAIAGMLIGVVGVAACFLLNGLSYVAVLAALLAMRIPSSRHRVIPPRSAWSNILEGLRYVAGEARTRVLLLNVAVMSICGLPALTLLPVLARLELGQGAREYGWMMSAVGGGALIGALTVATVANRIPKGRVVGWAAALFGASVAALGFSGSVLVALVILTVLGLAMITTTALSNMLLQTLVPDGLRGRVVSVYTFSFVGMAPIGAFLGGAAAERFGVAATLGVGGLLTIAAAGGLLLRSRELQAAR